MCSRAQNQGRWASIHCNHILEPPVGEWSKDVSWGSKLLSNSAMLFCCCQTTKISKVSNNKEKLLGLLLDALIKKKKSQCIFVVVSTVLIKIIYIFIKMLCFFYITNKIMISAKKHCSSASKLFIFLRTGCSLIGQAKMSSQRAAPELKVFGIGHQGVKGHPCMMLCSARWRCTETTNRAWHV